MGQTSGARTITYRPSAGPRRQSVRASIRPHLSQRSGEVPSEIAIVLLPVLGLASSDLKNASRGHKHHQKNAGE